MSTHNTGPDDEVKDPFEEGRGYTRGGLRRLCEEYFISWDGRTSAQMISALDSIGRNDSNGK